MTIDEVARLVCVLPAVLISLHAAWLAMFRVMLIRDHLVAFKLFALSVSWIFSALTCVALALGVR